MGRRDFPSIMAGFAAIVVMILAMAWGVINLIQYSEMIYYEYPAVLVCMLVLIAAIFALITHTENVGRADHQHLIELRDTAQMERDAFQKKAAANQEMADGHAKEIYRLSKCAMDDRETIRAITEDLRKAEGEVRTKTLIMNAVVASLVSECVRLHEIKANAVTNHTLKEMRFKLAEIIFSLVSAGGARLDQAEARSLGVLRDWLDEEVKARPGNFNESNPRVGYFVHAVCVISLAASREKADAAKAAAGAKAANGGKNASP